MAFSVGQTVFTPHGWQAEARVKTCWSQGAFAEVHTLRVFLKIGSAVSPRLPFCTPSPRGEAEACLKTNKPQSLQGVNIFHKCQRWRAGAPGVWHPTTGGSRHPKGEQCASTATVPRCARMAPGCPWTALPWESTRGSRGCLLLAPLPLPAPLAPDAVALPLPSSSPGFFGQGLI